MTDAGAPSAGATYLLALTSLPGIGPRTALRAARAFPEARALLDASPDELRAVGGDGFAKRLSVLASRQWPEAVEWAQVHIDKHRGQGITVLAIDDERYPSLMRLAPEPAVILYVRGQLAAIQREQTVAIIGTRTPTPRGLEVARRLAQSLADAGCVVVSGLAAGIDQAGHRGAMVNGGTTVAILGTAIDTVYPSTHRRLAEEIVAGGGALVSEYAIGMTTSGRHFFERDRLQAAMSVGVIPVQAGLKSGTLHTVTAALVSDRAVLTPRPLAGEADDPIYAGIHALIEAGRADVIENRGDYERLVAYLREHRQWLMGEATARPCFRSQQ